MKKAIIHYLEIKIFLFISTILLLLVPAKSAFAQQFTELTSASLTGVYVSSAAWGDYDNDGYLDVLLTGWNMISFDPVSKIFRNNGNGTFTEQTSISLTGVEYGSAAWGDYNNDGFIDILLTGRNSSGSGISKLYRNNKNGSFTEQTSVSLIGVYGSSAAWGDYDNDGYLDILLAGNSANGPVSRIYRNKGNGTFSEQTSISLIGVEYGSVAWGDYNNDGYLDILLTGGSNNNTSNNNVAKIYKNNGSGNFEEQTSISLTGVVAGSSAWGDYDNDGYLDILLTGGSDNGNVSKVYRNNRNGNFVEQTSISLTGVSWSSAAWGDYDNDGYLDILITGNSYTSASNRVSKIYRNNNGSFIEQTSVSLTEVVGGSAAWGDFDNDGDLDILLTGSSTSGTESKIYRNNTTTLNTAPAAPANLSSVVSHGNEVTFTWNKSTDNQTPLNGLNYNIVMGTSPNAINILSPLSDRSTGFRRVVRLGNSKSNSITIKDLPAGKYYWSVQAIDGAFQGSEFASESTFEIQPLSVIAPSAGVNWQVNSTVEILWKTNNYPVEKIRLEYSTDSGNSWIAIGEPVAAPATTLSWVVPNTPSENCRIRVSDASDPKISCTSDLFTISVPLNKPILISPVSNQVLRRPYLLQWQKYPAAEKYYLQVAADSLFTDLLIDDQAVKDTVEELLSLFSDTRYFWRVKAISASGTSLWSAKWTFKAAKAVPEIVLLAGPADNCLNQPVNLNLSWKRASGAEYYHIQVSDRQDFSTLALNDSTLTDTLKTACSLNNNTKYYWRLRAGNNGGYGEWSGVWAFTTVVALPAIPQLISPSNGVKNIEVNTKLSWQQAADAVSYRLQLSEDSTFTRLVINDSTVTSTSRDLTGLKTGMKYYWRVSAKNYSGLSSFSPVWNFVTLLPSADTLFAENKAVKTVTLSWKDNSDNELGFIIERKAGTEAAYKVLVSLKPDLTSYTDTTVMAATQYKYRIKAYSQHTESAYSNEASITTITSVNKEDLVAAEYSLKQNYPNPFNPRTMIKYALKAESKVKLTVYNSLGAVVKELVNSTQDAGNHEVSFNAGNISSGIYCYLLEASATDGSKDYREIKKMTLVK